MRGTTSGRSTPIPTTVSEKIDSFAHADRGTAHAESSASCLRRRAAVPRWWSRFLAVLELTRLKQFVLRQEDDFSEIEVSRRPGTKRRPVTSPTPTEVARSGCSSGGRTRGGGNGSTAAFVIFVPHSALIFVPNFFQMVQQLFFMELKFILESLLIAAPKPLSPGELRDILTRAADEEGAPETCACLPQAAAGKDRGRPWPPWPPNTRRRPASYRLACVAGAWQFVTLPDFAPFLRAFVGVKKPSRQALPARPGNPRGHRLPAAGDARRV